MFRNKVFKIESVIFLVAQYGRQLGTTLYNFETEFQKLGATPMGNNLRKQEKKNPKLRFPISAQIIGDTGVYLYWEYRFSRVIGKYNYGSLGK